MDTGSGRKRPREEDCPIDSESKHRDPSAAGPYRRQPPLPLHVGDRYSHGTETISRRKLPPLYTPSCNISASSLTTSSIQLSPLFRHQASEPRPRSQSLFDILQQPSQQRHESIPGRTEFSHTALEPNQSRSYARFGTDPTPHAAGGGACCSSSCQGQGCSTTRELMRKLAAELVSTDSRVRSLSQRDHISSSDPPDFGNITVKESLQWALNLVQWTNLSLLDHSQYAEPRSPEHNSPQPSATSTMRRGQYHHFGQREEHSPPARPYVGAQHGLSAFANPAMLPEQNRGPPYSSEIPPTAGSPHLTASSSGSVPIPSQSPMHAHQPSRSGMLPSPSSMSFTNVSSLPPISPPSAAAQSSAQATHLQDLQHQLSVKQLALQTLQREYDSLLQKLERQRTKCATLERKFEVSDVEINSLTDEKEKLQAQVEALESHVEELQQSRDETRRQLVSNGAQYMRIMEMASRLQAQGADDKKRWELEKVELHQRTKVLEEAMVTGNERAMSPPPSIVLAHSSGHASSSTPSSETINVLRAEIGRLRSRTLSLETALQTMRSESATIQEAAKTLMESGGKMEMATKGALG